MVSEQYGKWPECCEADAFRVEKLLTNSPEEKYGENYWLAPDQTAAEFVLDLGCNKILNMVELVNTHRSRDGNRGTKEFKVSVSPYQAGPWSQVLYETLEDPRQQTDPLPVLAFAFSSGTEVSARFVKFNLISWYGVGGGLQYFSVKKGKEIFLSINENMSALISLKVRFSIKRYVICKIEDDKQKGIANLDPFDILVKKKD